MPNEPYTLGDINFDFSSIEWVDGAVWIEGKVDGRDVSAGFDPVNIDPTGAEYEMHSDGITFRAFGRAQWLYDVETGDYLEIEQ